MQMRRGDVITVVAPATTGKPGPALIVRPDAFPESHASVVDMARLNVALAFVMGLAD
jgi:mRNA-degrading endonuclease toxin of MazEF toxin-antitoxin module